MTLTWLMTRMLWVPLETDCAEATGPKMARAARNVAAIFTIGFSVDRPKCSGEIMSLKQGSSLVGSAFAPAGFQVVAIPVAGETPQLRHGYGRAFRHGVPGAPGVDLCFVAKGLEGCARENYVVPPLGDRCGQVEDVGGWVRRLIFDCVAHSFALATEASGDDRIGFERGHHAEAAVKAIRPIPMGRSLDPA